MTKISITRILSIKSVNFCFWIQPVIPAEAGMTLFPSMIFIGRG